MDNSEVTAEEVHLDDGDRAGEIRSRLDAVRQLREQIALQQETINRERREAVRQWLAQKPERDDEAAAEWQRQTQVETHQRELERIAKQDAEDAPRRLKLAAEEARRKEEADARRRAWDAHRQVKDAERLALFRQRNQPYQEHRERLERLKRQNREERQRLIEQLRQSPPILKEVSDQP